MKTGLILSVWCLVAGTAAAQVERAEVNLDYVSKIAADRAKAPFKSPRAKLPDVLKPEKLDYDQYRKIRFDQNKAFWMADKLPFRVEFFHPGYLFQDPVRIFEFTDGHVQRIRFVKDFFNYSDLGIEKHIPADMGYAGFKVAHPLNKPGEYAELASFVGGSYYRVLGRNQRYGASARGLALDTDVRAQVEEFPLFTDFWLQKPKAEEGELHVLALLDSPTCTGAYDFHIRPGESTAVDVDVVLFFREPRLIEQAWKDRKPPTLVGIAPLTSMFLFGENSERKFDDYRPEVHDSDGLLVQIEGGETLWRPLNNASTTRHSTFSVSKLQGFGLLQRDRDFNNYHEIFHTYHEVPSVWVKPRADWGEGEVHLVEIASNREGFDNVVAFWNPKNKPVPGEPYRFGYQQLWTRETDIRFSENRVVATRIGEDQPGSRKRQIHIDFIGPGLEGFHEVEPPEVDATCTPNATIAEAKIFKNYYDGTWRVMLKFEPAEGNTEPVDFRCTLRKEGKPLTETWCYLWSPP